MSTNKAVLQAESAGGMNRAAEHNSPPEEKHPGVIRYRKLVRDRIPEIIASDGKTCNTSVLEEADYLRLLDLKLNEELQEYQESKSMEELADLLEVIRAVIAARGSSWDEVEAIRREKAARRGGFEKRILLESVTENP